MTTVSRNNSLQAARETKNDEFYTQWADIEREMNAYLEFDPDVFRDKVVLLPCDDPEWSNFAKFFALHFMDFGLKKLISTSYAPDSNSALFSYEPTLFEMNDPKFDETKTHTNGKKFVLEPKDISGDGIVNIDDLQWEYLEGDGDFRSPEVTALRDESDFVITNPPFSLFRQFMTWVVGGGRSFSVIGSNNAITYNEVFPHIMANALWKGATANSTDMVFGVPKGAKVSDADRLKAAKLGYPSDDERDYTRLARELLLVHQHRPRSTSRPAATDDHGGQHQVQPPQGGAQCRLSDLRQLPRHRGAICHAIPSDHDGMMGVPITFLDKYNPDQFEILGSSEGDFPQTKTYGPKERVVDGVRMKSNTGTFGCFVRTESFGPGTYFDVGYPVKRMYKRIFIRRKDAS